jgi:hypothetical protein
MMLVGFAVAPTFEAGAQSTLRPAEKSPLKRTSGKIKPKPASASRQPKALRDINPTGRKELPKQGQLPVPLDAIRRAMVFGGTSLQESIRANVGGGNMRIPVQGDNGATISEVYTVDGMPNQNQAMRNVIDAVRSGRSATSNEELQNIVRGDTSRESLDAARQRYVNAGYTEARLSGNEVVFVRSDDPCRTGEVVSMVENRVTEGMYRNWLDDWERYSGDREWEYDPCGRRYKRGIIAPDDMTLDMFILRGTLDPALEPTEQELAEFEMTDLELAESALVGHDYELAVERYDAYLKDSPEDAAAIRARGVALLHTNDHMSGVDAIARAYVLDPGLAGEPVAVDFFEDGAAGVSQLLQRVVPQAHRAPGYQPSLVAIALMQSQGRKKEAARMLDRAREKGLPEAIEREFVLAGIDTVRK